MFTAALLLPSTATAISVSSNSQLDFASVVDLDNSSFTSTGAVTFTDPGLVIFATGDFSAISQLTQVTLNNVAFDNPGVLWSVGGFTYTITTFTSISDDLISGFTAKGILSGNGFDDTETAINFSINLSNNLRKVSSSATSTPVSTFPASNNPPTTTVPVPAGFLLLGTALAGFGIARRK